MLDFFIIIIIRNDFKYIVKSLYNTILNQNYNLFNLYLLNRVLTLEYQQKLQRIWMSFDQIF